MGLTSTPSSNLSLISCLLDRIPVSSSVAAIVNNLRAKGDVIKIMFFLRDGRPASLEAVCGYDLRNTGDGKEAGCGQSVLRTRSLAIKPREAGDDE